MLDLNIGLDKMIVIGLDGVGKTTACKNLEKEGYTYLKFSAGDGADKIGMAKEALKKSASLDKFVFDRFYFPDELVYCKFTGAPDTHVEEWHEVIKEINKQGIKIVFVSDNIENIIERFEQRNDDDWISSDQLTEISAQYAKVLSKISCLVDVYLYDIPTVEQYGTLDV